MNNKLYSELSLKYEKLKGRLYEALELPMHLQAKLFKSDQRCDVYKQAALTALSALKTCAALMEGAPSVAPMTDELVLKAAREAIAKVEQALDSLIEKEPTHDYDRLLEINKIVNEVGTTWKTKRALLRRMGIEEAQIAQLVPENAPGDY
jgi:hypothetical protein